MHTIKTRVVRSTTGQTVAEYFLIMAAVLAAIISTGFVDQVKGALRNYFDKARAAIYVEKTW